MGSKKMALRLLGLGCVVALAGCPRSNAEGDVVIFSARPYTDVSAIQTGSGGAFATTGGIVQDTGGVPLGTGGLPLVTGGLPTATGGLPAVGTGGFALTGGTTSSGGFALTGGTISSGGFSLTGGTISSGGFSLTGGTISSGGFPLTGGTMASGGAAATGGMTASGGAMASGGVAETGGTPAVTRPATMQFSVTTLSQGGRYSPRNVGAIWVEKASGGFVKTLDFWANRRRQYLSRYNSAGAVDTVTTATLSSHRTHTVSWNMKDANGADVPDGDYRIWMECTEHNGAGSNNSVTVTIGADSQDQSFGNANGYQNISVSFN